MQILARLIFYTINYSLFLRRAVAAPQPLLGLPMDPDFGTPYWPVYSDTRSIAVESTLTFTPNQDCVVYLKMDVTVSQPDPLEIKFNPHDGPFLGIGDGYVSCGSGSMKVETRVDNMTYIANNGIAVVKGSGEYLYCAKEGNGDAFFAVKGNTDMPGVLAAGRVSSGGGYNFKWGTKLSNTPPAKQGTGQYRIYHNIGHVDYSVTANAIYSSTPCVTHIYNKTSTYVDVYVTNMSGTLRDNDFEFSITGKN